MRRRTRFGVSQWTSLGMACHLICCAGALLLIPSDTLAGLENLHNFNYVTDGSPTLASGIAAQGSTILGTCNDSRDGRGTIWSWDTSTHAFATLHEFKRINEDDVVQPEGDIVVVDSIIYGRTGWSNNTIWSFDTSTNTLTKLHDFNKDSDGFDQATPRDIAVSGTTIFGIAGQGGAYGGGTI